MVRYEMLRGLGQAESSPLYARPIFWAVFVGAIGLYVIFRKEEIKEGVEVAGRKISKLVSDAERTIIKKFVPKGREGYIDATFELGAKYNLDPYLILGILLQESRFGAGLSKGEYKGRPVYTGDFIPRAATYIDENGKTKNTSITNRLEKYPLPGVKRVYWERPQVGQLDPYKGEMWVPAHDIRVAKFGIPGAYTKSVNGPFDGGVGFGFTPWQLDWGSYAPKLDAGAAFDPDLATKVAIEDQILPAIVGLKKVGVKDQFDLIALVVASYNIGVNGTIKLTAKALREGKDPVKIATGRTAASSYVDTVLSIAKAAGHEIIV